MYSYIKGKIIEKISEKSVLIIETNGIGYEVIVSNLTFQEIKEEDVVKIYVVEITGGLYSSGLPTLYGFSSYDEKEIFLSFKDNLSNVGPKKALEYLDKAKKNIVEFKKAVKTKNHKILTSLFGFKHPSAEKIISSLCGLEIFVDEKISVTETINIEIYNDIISVLVNLGYKEPQIKGIVEKFLIENKNLYSEKTSPEIIQQILPIILRELSSIK
ncbi:MAG: hypothetical protein N2643_00060 [Endomicrobia bacterium]|nr:hypothetical protein [Endomicrobiia bacterium]